MIKLKSFDVMNVENAIRGARNPMNSWHKSDSTKCTLEVGCDLCMGCNKHVCGCYLLGENDLDLAKRLCSAGSDHRKFMRQIFVSVDITAPLYWWKEYDTYKVGTTANSTSTMHKIHSKPFEIEDFSIEKCTKDALALMEAFVIPNLESHRLRFNESNDKQDWYSIIQILPSSYNQMRTCSLTYENLRNIYNARRNHKLYEWHTFCDWIKKLPYSELITGGNENE